MPITCRSTLWPVGEVSVERRADRQVVRLREAVVDEGAVGAKLRDDLVAAAVQPVDAEDLRAAGIHRRRLVHRPEDLRVAAADVRDRLDAGCPRGRVAAAIGIGSKLFWAVIA